MRSPGKLSLAIVALGSAAALLAPPARADDAANPDEPQSSAEPERHRIDRTWLYTDDARVAEPMTVVGTSSFSYTHVGSSPSRIASPYPNVYNGFAGNTAQPGGMLGIGGEVGLLAPLCSYSSRRAKSQSAR